MFQVAHDVLIKMADEFKLKQRIINRMLSTSKVADGDDLYTRHRLLSTPLICSSSV